MLWMFRCKIKSRMDQVDVGTRSASEDAGEFDSISCLNERQWMRRQ